jgi:2-oxoglutarate ferredoxin oxidoreductase subunit beta
MPSIVKPPVAHPSLARNELGLTVRDYEGTMSTLCAGCGHDSITAAIVRALWELSTHPHRIAKLSGIGCSSAARTDSTPRTAECRPSPPAPMPRIAS